MNLYCDSSALVKVYLDEPGSDEIRALAQEATLLAVSVVGLPEAMSAIRRAAVAARVSPDQAGLARTELLLGWESVVSLALDEDALDRAVEAAWNHSLRGFDAIHLGSALGLAEGLDEAITFATFDRVLWRAALECGLEAWPPDFA